MIPFLFALIVLGALAYIVEHYIPLDPLFRALVRLVLAVIVIGLLLQLLGVPLWPAPLRVP